LYLSAAAVVPGVTLCAVTHTIFHVNAVTQILDSADGALVKNNHRHLVNEAANKLHIKFLLAIREEHQYYYLIAYFITLFTSKKLKKFIRHY
jgi:hypothetical protein